MMQYNYHPVTKKTVFYTNKPSQRWEFIYFNEPSLSEILPSASKTTR